LVQEVTSGGANVGAAVAVPSGTSLIDSTGLAANTTYYYKVAAVNDWGAAGPYSAAGSGLTPSAPGAAGQPTGSPPAGTSGRTRINLSWTAPGSNGGSPITDYVIERATNVNGTWTTVNDGTNTNLSYQVTGLSRNTTYYFRVAAVNVWGTGANSPNSAGIRTNN
jgi:hypothetical protein